MDALGAPLDASCAQKIFAPHFGGYGGEIIVILTSFWGFAFIK